MFAHLFYLLVLAAFVIVQKPSLLLKPHWVQRGIERVLQGHGQSQAISWSGLSIQSRSKAFLEPEIQIRWNTLHISMPSLHASTGQGEITAVASFRSIPPHISQIETVQIAKVDAAAVSQNPTAPSTTQTASSAPQAGQSGFAIPPWLRSAEVGRIWVQVSQWRVNNSDHGTALVTHTNASPGLWRWNLQATESAHLGRAELQGVSTSHTLEGPWALGLDANVSRISSGKGQAVQLHSARIADCHLRLSGSSRLNVSCPIVLSGRLPRAIPHLRFGNRIESVLIATVTSQDLFDTNQRVTLDADLRLKPIEPLGPARGIGQIAGGLKLAGDLVPSEPARKWKLKSTLDLELRIDHFRRLVRFLEPTKYAVPAPFAALRGNIVFAARGEIRMDRAEIPILLQTRLRSANQDFDLDAHGILRATQLDPVPRAHLDLTLNLTDVRIPLPHLEITSVPELVPDARITAKPPKKSAHQQAGHVLSPIPPEISAIDYHIVIQTTKKPLRIETNLAKAEIPVHLELTLDSGKKPLGLLHVDSFPVELFHRQAKVQYFELDLTPKERKLSGQAEISYTDYVIYAKLLGTVDHPAYQFTSEPPLSDSDIISVLLFGQTSSDLDASQSQSVGSIRSAVTSRAMNLASMYLLASTPIESVGYDPESGTVTMRFRLASGTSLNVTEGQQQLPSIGIRHRLGKHWAIITQVGNPADPTDQSISALFQWSNRY